MTKIAESIVKNHETVSHYEKLVKAGLAIAILGYIALSADTSGANPESLTWSIPVREILEGMTNMRVLKDFAGKEGMWLVVVVTLFHLARSYNNYLDKLELELYEAEIKKRK